MSAISILWLILFIFLWIKYDFGTALVGPFFVMVILQSVFRIVSGFNWPIIISVIILVWIGFLFLTAIKEVRAANAQTLKMYGSGPVAIDGANLWGRVYSDTDEDHQKAFEAVANLLVRLKASGYDPHVFWDSKFHRLAKRLQLAGLSEGLPNMLSELLSIEKQMITVSQVGLAADADIVAWATLKKAAIISNDNYNKEIEDEIILSRVSALKERGLLKKFSHSAGDIVVPGLTNLV